MDNIECDTNDNFYDFSVNDNCFSEDRKFSKSSAVPDLEARPSHDVSDKEDRQTDGQCNKVDFEKFRQSSSVVEVNISDYAPEWRDKDTGGGDREGTSKTKENTLILKKIVRLGEGDRVARGSFVRYRYAAYIDKASVPFDSTKLRGDRVESMRLGQGMIPGLEIALYTMRKGEFAVFLIHYSLAYGVLGVPPRIPPRSTIWFEISLVSFGVGISVDEYAELSEEENDDLRFDELLQMTCEERAEATALFRIGEHRSALTRYAKLIRVHERLRGRAKAQSDSASIERTLVELFVNAAICFGKLNMHDRARLFARQALSIDARCAKAHFRVAKSCEALGDLDEAARSFERALDCAPQCAEIVEALRYLKRTRESSACDRAMCMRMCGIDPASQPTEAGDKSGREIDGKLVEREKPLDFERRLLYLVTEQPRDAYVEYPLTALSDAQRESLDTALSSSRLQGRLLRTNIERNGRIVVHIAKQSSE